MTIVNANMLEQVTQVFMDAQTELVFFALAVGTHLLFFNKFSFKNLSGVKPKFMKQTNQQRGAGAHRASLVALKASLRAGDIKAAMTNFEALHGLFQQQDSPSSAPHVLLEQLVKLAAEKNVLPDLLQLAENLGLVSKVLDLVLAECANQGDSATLKQAERLGRACGAKFTTATYQALIKGASTCGTTKDAQQVLAEAQQNGVADVMTYTSYIKGLMKKGNMQEARTVMATMRTEGLTPNVIAFNGLLGAAVASNVENIFVLTDEMKAFDVKPDSVTCSILLKTITPKSKPSSLEKVITLIEILESEIDEVLVNSVVEATVRAGRADLLVNFLKKHQGLKIKAAHTYGSIIRAYGYVQDVKGAWATWNEMKRQHVKPISVTLGCMCEALTTNGDIEGGYELIHQAMQDEATAPLVNAVMYGSIIKGFSHKKCFERMWQIYDEMVAAKLKFSMVTFNTLIDACSRSGELGRIPALLKDMDAQNITMGLVTYGAILKGYCQTNRLDAAFELVEDMKKTTKLEPDEIMYNTLLDGCARQGLYERGMGVFESMKKTGVRPSNFTLSVLVKLCNRGKKLEKAFEICMELSSKHNFRLNVHVFSNLIQACIQHHDLPRAISVLEWQISERVKPEVRTYMLLLQGCIANRSATDADGLLRAAMGLRGVHPQLVQFMPAAAAPWKKDSPAHSSGANTMQPQGGLPGDLISETIAGIMGPCSEERLAAKLIVDIGHVSSVKLDPKLRLRLAARMGEQ